MQDPQTQTKTAPPARPSAGKHPRRQRRTGNGHNSIELSIVMPCLNESETLATCIRKARSFLDYHKVAGEIIVADNGSTDGSPDIAARLGARVIHIPVKGYGAALIGGINSARGRYLIMGDADDSYDFLNLHPFLEKLREGYDLVMGNRFQGGIVRGAMRPLHRFLGNPVLTGFGRLFFKSPCRDFHCGLRGFSKEAAQRMQLRTTGMEFASEMVVKATLHRMRIAEVPTTLSPDGRSRPPHLRSWRDGWRHLRFLLLYSPRWLFLLPGLVLMAVGTSAGAWLLQGPRNVFGVVLDVHSLMYAMAAVIVGFQAVIFSIFTKVFAITEGLLPEDRRLNAFFKLANLEIGLALGALMMLAGAGMSVHAYLTWSSRSFGPLNPSETLRSVIPAVTLFILGCEIVLSSFFLSILGLRRK